MRCTRLAIAFVTLAASTVLTVATTENIVLAISSVDIAGPTGSGAFGEKVLVLANGNFVVVDSGWDAPGPVADVGAVYLYDGMTHALLSTLTGATAGDAVGSDGVTEVGTSNFVVNSSGWHNPASTSAMTGAVTWMSGTIGVAVAVSASNSLVGSTAGDGVGTSQGVTVLTNGNYVASALSWDDGSTADVGAATWGNGGAGVSGPISSGNSLIGARPSDQIGWDGVVALTNGNYVVASDLWDAPGPVADVGALTWGNGANGTSGIVDSSNSVIGSAVSDRVGRSVVALTNGNYVIGSDLWDDGSNADAGAATWVDGSSAAHFVVGTANSTVGTQTGDGVGYQLTALTNGNYVIASPFWDDGAIADAGAATWANGFAMAVGTVSSSNSVIGSQANDSVGSSGTVALTNGNYVVVSPPWANGSLGLAGAVTWGDGAHGTFGAVSSANSLVGGQAGDLIGVPAVTPLANGNYVVGSVYWHTPTADPFAGAITWGNGLGGAVGIVDASNSLVGTHAFDQAGVFVTPLSNGNYVVDSPGWTNGTIALAGAVTWGSGTSPVAGAISAANSLVGTNDSDDVGYDGVTALPNGNYLVASGPWGDDNTAALGAVTFANGSTGVIGPVSAANSLVGSQEFDDVGRGLSIGKDSVVVLPDNAYFVISRDWQNSTPATVGAVTFGGLAGVTGPVTAANSVIGSASNDLDTVSSDYIADGSVVIGRPGTNRVTLLLTDLTPPTFASAPANLTAATAPGAPSAAVTFANPVATDNLGTPSVACSPNSGTSFPVGTTTVTCTATNTEQLTATTSFTVTVTATPAPVPPPPDYLPLTPARLADTRSAHTTVDGLFAGGGAIDRESTLVLHVAGRGGVPASAVAAALNVTATDATIPGYLTVYPCGSPRPTASNLNFTPGSTVPNAVTAKIGDNGDVCIVASQAVHVVVDVDGAFPLGSTFAAINPARLLDTRAGYATVDGAQQATGAVADGTTTVLHVAGRAGVPSDAVAVVLNVTVTEPTRAGYATAYPCGGDVPVASNLNYVAGETIPNLVISQVGAGGSVCIYTQSGAHLVADVDGYFPTTTSYHPVVPARLLDTRPGFTTVDGQAIGADIRPAGSVTTVHVTGRAGVPVGATTAVLNVTATAGTGAGFVTVYPCGATLPVASNLNYSPGQTIPNASISMISATGDVCLLNSQPTQLVVDVNGYFP